MTKAFLGAAAIGLMLLSPCLTIAPTAEAGENPVVDALKATPVSVLTYALSTLRQDFRYAFSAQSMEPYAMFTAPLSGPIADIGTVIYNKKNDTILLNLVKIHKLDDGATPDDACRQAMAGLRTYAGVDPATGKLQDGVEQTMMASAFALDGTALPDAATPAEIDKLFRLRFNGSTGTARFSCTADLFAIDYTMTK